MPADLLTLVAKRDYTKVASGGSMVHCLLKPMAFEMMTGQALIIRKRQECMRELLESEFAQQQMEIEFE
ncbi:hypothetical protein ACLKA6_006738 [Drosophila palustris]